MTKQLPATPNIRHLRNQAKRFLKLCQAGDPECVDQLRSLHPSFQNLTTAQLVSKMCLHNAQLAIARSYGFQNWMSLCTCANAMSHTDLSALTQDQVLALLVQPGDSNTSSSQKLVAINSTKLTAYEKGRPQRENGGIIISENEGLTLEEACNDRAKLHGMPPIGTLYTNKHGIAWKVEHYAFFKAPTTFARYPNDCDYLPIVEPQNISMRLRCLISEVDRCTSKWVLFLDTMPETHPFGLGRHMHCAHLSADPEEAHLFLDVQNVHETTFAHELAHLWLVFVEGGDGSRILRDRSDNAKNNQLDFIQSFVLDIKVNDLIEKRGFDMDLISRDQIAGLEALRGAIMLGHKPPTRREMLLFCLQIAAVVLEQKRWPVQNRQRLPHMLDFFAAAVPEIYATALELVDSVNQHGVNTREAVHKTLDECIALGFEFTRDDFDLQRDLEEVTHTECMQDKFPEELAGMPVPLKLEVGKVKARHGIRGEGRVSVSTSPSGMAMLTFSGKDGGCVGPIQVNYRRGLPEHQCRTDHMLRSLQPREQERATLDSNAPNRHIPIMERPLIQGMIPDNYGRLPSDNGYNTCYTPGQDPFSQMEQANSYLHRHKATQVSDPFAADLTAFGLTRDEFGRAPGETGYRSGHPALPRSSEAHPKSHQPIGGASPVVWPNLAQTRRYMAGLALSVAQTRLAQQRALRELNLYQYAYNNPTRYVDPSGLTPSGTIPPPTYPTCPIPKCFGPKGEPLFTDLEICNAYKAMPGVDLSGGTGVLCCQGHKSICVFGAPDWPEYPGWGSCSKLDECLTDHESKHFGDVKCTGKALYRPNFRDPNPEFGRQRECVLRRKTVECLLGKGKFSGACLSAAEIMAEYEQDYINKHCNGIF